MVPFVPPGRRALAFEIPGQGRAKFLEQRAEPTLVKPTLARRKTALGWSSCAGAGADGAACAERYAEAAEGGRLDPRELAALYARALRQLGLLEVDFVGYSLGGGVGQCDQLP